MDMTFDATNYMLAVLLPLLAVRLALCGLPDYCHDLNAMHEAENWLKNQPTTAKCENKACITQRWVTWFKPSHE